MAQIEKVISREALEAEIRKLSTEQQIFASVVMGPGRLFEQTVESMGGPIKFTRQLLSRNPEENEEAIATMFNTIKSLTALADTDKLQQIRHELVAKAEKAVQEGNPYDISMLTIAAVAEFSPLNKSRLLSKVDDLPHDAGTLHKTIDAPNLRPELDPSGIAFGKQYDPDLTDTTANRRALTMRIQDVASKTDDSLEHYRNITSVDPDVFWNLVRELKQPILIDKVKYFDAQLKQLDDIQEKLSKAKQNDYFESYENKVQNDKFDYKDYSSAEEAREYAKQAVNDDFSQLKGDIFTQRNYVINDELGELARQDRLDASLQQQNQSQPVASQDGP